MNRIGFCLIVVLMFVTSVAFAEAESDCKIVIKGSTISETQVTGTPVTFTVNAANSCGEALYYRWSFHPGYGTVDYDDTNWQLLTTSEYVTENSISHTFDSTGKYVVVVWVVDSIAASSTDEGVAIIGWSVNITEPDESDTQSYNIADYFPMTAGYGWTYSVTNCDHDFLKRECGYTQSFNSESVVPIGYMYSYDGGSSYDPWLTADFNYFTLDDRGLLWQGCNDISSSGEDKILIPETPLTITSRTFSVGDSWTNTLQVDGESITAYFEIIAAGETVTVSAGTYTDTIRLYESTGDEGQRYIWLARDVGIVKVESLHNSDSGILAMGDSELISTEF